MFKRSNCFIISFSLTCISTKTGFSHVKSRQRLIDVHFLEAITTETKLEMLLVTGKLWVGKKVLKQH